jgi:hypothetical protein
MNMHKKIIFSDTVVAQEIDGETVLFDMDSENYFGLDAVGTVIWDIFQENSVLSDVLLHLVEMYDDIDENILKKDLLHFVERLEENGLVEVKNV